MYILFFVLYKLRRNINIIASLRFPFNIYYFKLEEINSIIKVTSIHSYSSLVERIEQLWMIYKENI